MNNKITITIPYYEAPLMLRAQFFQWHKYPEWAWEYINIIVVDDGSPTKPAEAVFSDVTMPSSSVSLYHIQEDIPWNHGGTRNLAFSEMEEGWAVLTDLDHVLPLESVVSLLTMDLSPDVVYIPARYRMLGSWDWEEINRHSNSFILTRKKFWEVGGFDEDFSGYWNGVSGPFRKELRRKAEFRELDTVHFLLYGRDLVKDANVESLGRKGSAYDILLSEVDQKKFNKINHPGNYHPKDPLRFKWEKVI